MILILRGHIRNSFNNLKLYNLINQIYETDQNIKIYIHTWNIFSNNISCRQIESNNTPVTEEIIYNYFNDLKHLIKHIIIDDDTNIELIGNTDGNINNGPTPLLGWKNYWYGKYQIINYIYNHSTPDEIYNTKCINMRFDLLDLTDKNMQLDSVIIYFLKNFLNYDIKKNIFTKNVEHEGIDNIYIGNIDTIFKLTHHFFYFLDDILLKYTDNIHQEYFVFRENNVLFPEIIETSKEVCNIGNSESDAILTIPDNIEGDNFIMDTNEDFLNNIVRQTNDFKQRINATEEIINAEINVKLTQMNTILSIYMKSFEIKFLELKLLCEDQKEYSEESIIIDKINNKFDEIITKYTMVMKFIEELKRLREVLVGYEKAYEEEEIIIHKINAKFDEMNTKYIMEMKLVEELRALRENQPTIVEKTIDLNENII
uniref:Uncharacterized protein n=1 Tax=viral metagenome TaxID=1070528 RepID=A0A6C0CV11_9ZZZZ